MSHISVHLMSKHFGLLHPFADGDFPKVKALETIYVSNSEEIYIKYLVNTSVRSI